MRDMIALVTQDVRLFHGTIRDNLTFYDTTVPDERLLEVVSDLGLGSWLRELPNGLDTELPTDGGGLSAGEAQLLAFARAFLKDPSVVILDEASSRLDRSTEQLIERTVDKPVQVAPQLSSRITCPLLNAAMRYCCLTMDESSSTATEFLSPTTQHRISTVYCGRGWRRYSHEHVAVHPPGFSRL